MITLTNLRTKYGASIGRADRHMITTDVLSLHLERVPLVDGGYDCGGAYWGAPSNLWHYASNDDENEVYGFVRAESRVEAMVTAQAAVHDWADVSVTFLPETGSIIEQTIQHLQAWVDYNCNDEDLDAAVEDAEIEIADLQDELQQIRHPNSFHP